jgi:hypothetical protein
MTGFTSTILLATTKVFHPLEKAFARHLDLVTRLNCGEASLLAARFTIFPFDLDQNADATFLIILMQPKFLSERVPVVAWL